MVWIALSELKRDAVAKVTTPEVSARDYGYFVRQIDVSEI
jgi:hypothetical protein